MSEQLSLHFLSSRVDDKPALLLYLLNNVVPAGEQTVVFAATKHHVEYLKEVYVCMCELAVGILTSKAVVWAYTIVTHVMVIL